MIHAYGADVVMGFNNCVVVSIMLRETLSFKTIYIDKGIRGEEQVMFCESQSGTSRYGWVLF